MEYDLRGCSVMENCSQGNTMYKLATELFPLCRSITGKGTRDTKNSGL